MLYSDIRSPGLRINLNEGRKTFSTSIHFQKRLRNYAVQTENWLKNYDRALFNALKPAKKKKSMHVSLLITEEYA